MLVDEVRITVKAGDGGNGCLAFRREKYVPRGGPSGGDGGRGGDVVMVATIHRNTLLHFRFNPEYTAQRGRHGEGSNRTGHEGESITVQVPVGTTVIDEETGETLFDFTEDGQTWIAAKSGRGGRGNARFTSSTHQAPTEHEPGKPGEFRKLQLKLKLLADVGLVGYPNAGKSTLISRISAARPKIADYPFTTLEPNLGVVQMPDMRTFVVADIPGIIEGAHEGRGLGIQFLRHVERTRVLVHMVDMSETGRDVTHDFETLMRELASFDEGLARKPMFLVASKMDVAQDEAKVETLRQIGKSHDLPFFEISSATGLGLEALKFALAERVFIEAEKAAAAHAEAHGKPLQPAEMRVLGVLIEKESTTPEYYPMSLNSLVAACNQKTNRWPVTEYNEDDVLVGLEGLKHRGFAAAITGGSRVTKYAQRFTEKLNMGRRETAILCVLMLRGPQTIGEIKGRTERMYDFADLDETETVLHKLTDRDEGPLVQKLPHAPGTKEPRYATTLGGVVEFAAPAQSAVAASPLSERLAALEAEVANLRAEVGELKRRLDEVLS